VTRLTTCADPEAVAERAAADIARYLRRVSSEAGVVHLALSGGTTPKGSYERLAARPADLAGAEIWFADERCVPPEDEESNYRLVAESLLRPARVAAELVHRMEGELGPDEGARRYAQALREGVIQREADLPVLDLIVLGIGPDGHIASLFPGSPLLDVGDDAICLGVHDSPKPPPERITLSLAVLRAARRCLLLATGASKADAVDAMLAAPSRHVPASLLRRERLTVIVDDAAAPRGPRR
jgi:6-phosphogluconolactonase